MGPKFSEHISFCERCITEKDLYDSLKIMQNNKSSRYDCLTKDFYDTFWNHVKKPQINIIREAKLPSFAHRQAIIILTEEKVKDKGFRFRWMEKMYSVLPG